MYHNTSSAAGQWMSSLMIVRMPSNTMGRDSPVDWVSLCFQRSLELTDGEDVLPVHW